MKTNYSKKGFTLLELMISIFIFSVVVLVVGGIFGRGMVAYRYADNLQKGMEEAQFAMGKIAKVLRTSNVVASSGTSITVYDASQGKCIVFAIVDGAVTQRTASPISSPSPFDRCNGVSYGSAVAMTSTKNGTITGLFDVIASTRTPTGRVGRVSILFVIKALNNNSSVRLQSSVSLRDYKASGLL